MPTLNMTFGTLIGTHRIQCGLSQVELAKRLGVSDQYLNDIEHGRRQPKKLELLRKMSAAINLDLDVLCFAAGVLPPDIMAMEPRKSQIIAAFAAMREALR